MKTAALLLLLACCCAVALPHAKKAKQADRLPLGVNYTSYQQFPEGMDWDPIRNRFLLGSLNRSVITSVNFRGKVKDVIVDPAIAGLTILGIKVHNDKVYAVLHTAYKPELAFEGIGVWDLKTGARLLLKNFTGLPGPAGPAYANDLTLDNKGNIYVTDCFRGLIWKVDTKGKASVWSADPIYKTGEKAPGPSLPFILNGLVYHPGGYLLTVATSGEIYKVNITTGVAKRVIGVRIPDGNGLRLRNDGRLVAISHHRAYLIEVFATDNWDAAIITDVVLLNKPDFPTSAALVPRVNKTDYTYVNYGKLTMFTAGIKEISNFTIAYVPYRV